MSAKRRIVKKLGKKRAGKISSQERKTEGSKSGEELSSSNEKIESLEKENRLLVAEIEERTAELRRVSREKEEERALLMREIEELKIRVEDESTLKDNLRRSVEEARKENERLRREISLPPKTKRL